MIAATTLRPGFLVSMKTTVPGGVHYIRRDLEGAPAASEIAGDEAERVTDKWETERTIEDPKEYKAARTARSKACGAVRSVCSQSAFGLLCPEVDADKLDKAVEEAQRIVAEFNEGSSRTTIAFFILKGRVMPDDVAAIQAISSEVRELMSEMVNGVENGNATAIREAASRVKGIGEMLSADAQAKVDRAVKTARDAATKIKKQQDAKGTVEVDRSVVNRLTELRASFLDLSDATEVDAPKAAGRTLDLVDQAESR